MNATVSKSENAQRATELVKLLQNKLVKKLESLTKENIAFKPIHWLRDEGKHGGGTRFVSEGNKIFNRASVNFSHVHYDDIVEKKLASASAISAIIHPDNPYCPSAHFHFSWTEMRDGTGYWRMMADLNPAIPNEKSTAIFNTALTVCANDYYIEGKENGDNYFYIPGLDVHRGVSHFYLEGFDRKNFSQDYEMAEKVASHMIDTYHSILESTLNANPTYTIQDKQNQIDYHTLYLYQVLTLDKGTTAGILVHNQNDLGVLGSLPSKINAQLLESWAVKTPAPFNELVQSLCSVLGKTNQTAAVEDNEKLEFVKIIRSFYKKYPECIHFKNS